MSHIFERGSEEKQKSVSFLLLHDLNLHCINLYLPLKLEGASQDLKYARNGRMQRDNHTEPPKMSYNPETNMLKITYQTESCDKWSEYFRIILHTKIVHNKSYMNFANGSYLKVRLPVDDFSVCAQLKVQISTRYPRNEELQIQIYENGVSCRKCACPIIGQYRVKSTRFGTRTPWKEIVESLTCVELSQYDITTVDLAFDQNTLNLVEDEVVINKTTLDCNESLLERDSIILKDNFLICKNCQFTIGSFEDKMCVFKHSISVPQGLFLDYSFEMYVAYLLIDSSNHTGTRRFEIRQLNGSGVLLITLVSQYTMLKSNKFSSLIPILKMLYEETCNKVAIKADETEQLSMRENDYDKLISILSLANKEFPLNGRKLNSFLLGFLRI